MTDAALGAIAIADSHELESPARRALRRLFQRKGAVAGLVVIALLASAATYFTARREVGDLLDLQLKQLAYSTRMDDLLRGRLRILGVGVGHRLHDDGICAADPHAANRHCQSCGHDNPPFPMERWGWRQYVQQTHTVNDARRALDVAIAQALGSPAVQA